MKQRKKLKEAYEKMTKDRQPYLDRAREYAKLTIPYLMPEDTATSQDEFSQGWQSLGAEALNTFSNKFMNTLFPSGMPFFNVGVDTFSLSETELKAYEENKNVLSNTYVQIVIRAMYLFEKRNLREKLVTYFKQLILSGNCCLQLLDKKAKVIRLDKYVAKRDAAGTLIKLIIKEKHAMVTLPDEIQKKILAESRDGKKDEAEVYTCYKRISSDEFIVLQETDEGVLLHKEKVKEKSIGIIVGRFNSIDGEDYGRGHVEDYASDIRAYNFLAEYQARGAATMLNVKYLVKPGALVDIKVLNDSPAGTFVQGKEGDIIPLDLANYKDTAMVSEVMAEYKSRISRAFLITSGTVRDSERTTKYEIEQNVLDLENARAGSYASQTSQTQLPLAMYLLDDMSSKLTQNGIEPNIETGLEAISRQNKLQRLRQYTEMISLTATWDEQTQSRLDKEAYNNFISELLYLDTSEFFLSNKAAVQQQNADNDNEAANALTGGVASGVGQAIAKNMTEQR